MSLNICLSTKPSNVSNPSNQKKFFHKNIVFIEIISISGYIRDRAYTQHTFADYELNSNFVSKQYDNVIIR